MALFTYFGFLIAYTPAAFITQLISQANPNAVQFSGVSGTLFSGKANAVSAQGMRVNDVNWELSPVSILLLNPSANIKGGNIRDTNSVYLKGNISASLLNQQAFSAKDLSIFVPTKTLLAQIKLPVFVTASGRLRLDINELDFNGGCNTLSGKGSWLNAAVSVNNKPVDFGTFTGNLSCESPSLVAQIMPENKLSLDAKFTLQMNGKYKVDGRFKMPSDLPNEIRQAARFFGTPTSEGYYNISL